MRVSGRVAATFVVCGAIGEAALPLLIELSTRLGASVERSRRALASGTASAPPAAASLVVWRVTTAR